MVTKNACDYWIPAFAGMTRGKSGDDVASLGFWRK
jgi:hypothetical protein